MSKEYSIKKYLQKKSKELIGVNDINQMGREIEMESNKRYSEKSALNIISRYIDVVNGEVVFDFENRDQTRNFNSLSQKIISSISQDKQTAVDSSNNFVENRNISKKTTVVKKDRDTKAPIKKTSVNISNDAIENELSPHEEINNIQKENKTKTLKKDIPEKKKTALKKTTPLNNQMESDGQSLFGKKKTAPLNNQMESDGQSLFGKKKTTPASNPKESDGQSLFGKKKTTPASNPKESDGQSLFGKKKTTPLNNQMESDGQSLFGKKKTTPLNNQMESDGQSLFGKKKTTPTSNPKEFDGQSLFGKGKLIPEIIQNESYDRVDRSRGSDESDDDNEYKKPTEPPHKKLYRTGYQYEPYGTDNYHDDCQVNDSIGRTELKRTTIFDDLASREYPAQRSPEWFKWRDTMITASDGGTVVGVNPYENPYEFVLKKVFGKPFITSIDCYHGKKYEFVATAIYGYRMNVEVEEFGLCQHPKYKFLGASPDGIVSKYKLNRKEMRKLTRFVGRMLEIKCPMRRHILMDRNAPIVYGVHGEPIRNLKYDVKKGICPTYYWVQVQLQLQCCDLDECDFWQCEISEYMDRDEFMDDTDSDYPWISRSAKHEKGAVIQLMPIERLNEPLMTYDQRIWNFAEFIYQPRVDMSPYEIDQWIVEALENLHTTHQGRVVERVLYWKMNKTRNTTIPRDDKWFEDNLDKFSDIWKLVEYFRNNKDRAELLNRYIKSLNKKTNEHVMETMNMMADEPNKTASPAKHTAYIKYITQLEKFVKDNFKENIPKDTYDEDIKCIKNVADRLIPDDPTEQKKFKELLQKLRSHVDQFLSGDTEKDEESF